MLPVVTRSAEVVLLLVPDSLREAALALGAPRWRVIFARSCCRRPLPGLVTGSLLAVARAAGETAPLLFTVGDRARRRRSDLGGRMNSLPIQIFNDVGQAQDRLVERAWGAALTLVAMILLLTLVARLIARRSRSDMSTDPTSPTETRPVRPAADRPARGSQAAAAETPRAARRGDRAAPGACARGAARLLRRRRTRSRASTSTYAPNQVTAMIGPSGCGKSTLVRCINRMHEEIPGARAEGKVMLDDVDIYGAGVDVVAVRRAIGMVFQKPNPFPTMSIFDNVAAGLRLTGTRGGDLQASASSASLRGAGLWDEVKDRLGKPGHRPLRRPAAAPVHRAHDRGRARGDPDGRAVLGARPDRDAEDRGADRRAQAARTRS